MLDIRRFTLEHLTFVVNVGSRFFQVPNMRFALLLRASFAIASRCASLHEPRQTFGRGRFAKK